jgi:hypothetical protein
MSNTRVLKKGSAGTDVELWQYFLIGQGFDPGPADGSFSDDTVTATKAFQLTHGLLADGIVGRATYGVAFALGFALEDEEPHGPGWPALPPFPPLGDGAREGLFGRFAYVAAPVPSNRERIRITDDWESRNLVRVELPVGKKSFHRLGAAQLAALWDESSRSTGRSTRASSAGAPPSSATTPSARPSTSTPPGTATAPNPPARVVAAVCASSSRSPTSTASTGAVTSPSLTGCTSRSRG